LIFKNKGKGQRECVCVCVCECLDWREEGEFFVFLFIYLFILHHVIFRIYSEKSISIDKELKDAKTGKKRERERNKFKSH
jgi:hypothetical protein